MIKLGSGMSLSFALYCIFKKENKYKRTGEKITFYRNKIAKDIVLHIYSGFRRITLVLEILLGDL